MDRAARFLGNQDVEQCQIIVDNLVKWTLFASTHFRSERAASDFCLDYGRDVRRACRCRAAWHYGVAPGWQGSGFPASFQFQSALPWWSDVFCCIKQDLSNQVMVCRRIVFV